MQHRLNHVVVLCIFVLSIFGSLALFSIPASAQSGIVAKNTIAFPDQCTYKFNLGTSHVKTLQGSCDAQRYIKPYTACGQDAEQDASFSVNGDTVRTKIFYFREQNPCSDIYIGGAEEGVFAGSHPVTWYGFTYNTQFTYATCYYLNGDYGNYLPIYPNFEAPAGHNPLFTNYGGVGCVGNGYGNFTPPLT